ncbi:MAG TPA: ComF family protein [Bacteroidota bacterium]|nr:ComF family protein [Bacteroidota bacterium]
MKFARYPGSIRARLASLEGLTGLAGQAVPASLSERFGMFGLTVLRGVADVFYPPLCLICQHAPVGPRERICAGCRSTMRSVDPSHPLRREAEAKLTSGGTVDGFLPLFLFEKEGALQQALHLMKYSGMHSLGAMFGREMGARMASMPGYRAADCLVPVPLHSARRRERGYNQSERICSGIGEVTGKPILTGTLLRRRNTPSQTALKLHEREDNVKGAFRVPRGREKLLRGKSVILVDDVMTTGSTLLACADALRAAGARAILVATVAVADRTS